MQELAVVMGPENVFFLSQDDKARVAIGLTAANKQLSQFPVIDNIFEFMRNTYGEA